MAMSLQQLNICLYTENIAVWRQMLSSRNCTCDINKPIYIYNGDQDGVIYRFSGQWEWDCPPPPTLNLSTRVLKCEKNKPHVIFVSPLRQVLVTVCKPMLHMWMEEHLSWKVSSQICSSGCHVNRQPSQEGSGYLIRRLLLVLLKGFYV